MRLRTIAAVVCCGLLSACTAAASSDSAGKSTPPLPHDLVAVSTAAESAVAKIMVTTCTESGVGSGFFVDSQHIVTAAHVVENTVSVKVEFGGGTYDATVTGIAHRPDIAVLTLIKGRYRGTPLKLADNDPKVGAAVAAIGYPEGGALTATRGSVTATNASVRVVDDNILRTRMVKTDALVSPGNSGGPLVGLDSKVYGVVHAGEIYSTAYGFAVSAVVTADQVRAWLADPQDYAKPECESVTPTQPWTPTGAIHPSSWPSYDYYGPADYDVCRSAPYPFQGTISVETYSPPDSPEYWAISSVQASLRALNYGSPTTVDGIYGTMTESAVMSFQRNKGLPVDGEIGPDTWAMLIATDHYWKGLCN